MVNSFLKDGGFLKIMFYLVMLLVIFNYSFKNVSALGVTPGRTTFDFEPGKEVEAGFEVINSEHEKMEIVVLVQGELNASISVSEVSFKMKESEERKRLVYKFKMPSSLSPGGHTAEVVVLKLPEKSPKSEAFIGSAVGVATQIQINVPYPGKYAEASLNVIGPDDGKITFVIPIVSLGDLDIVRARGTIDIYTSLNEKIETLQTNEVSILSKERKEIVAEWDVNGVNPGGYKAVATVIYDEETLNLEKEFSIGNRILELIQAEVNDFLLGEIAKFELLVENKWSEPILGAFAQMQIFNNQGGVLADFKSQTYDVGALEKKLFVAFWDTDGVKKGNYNSAVFLKYGSQETRTDLELKVKDSNIDIVGTGYVISKSSSKSGNSLTTILVTAIIVLVLINLLWFLVLRKKLKKNR